jgi:hypothetical protein
MSLAITAILLLDMFVLACGFPYRGYGDLSEESRSTVVFQESLKVTPDVASTAQGVIAEKEAAKKVDINIEKWKRFEVILNNPSWSGNPFDLEVFGVFTHQATGRAVKQLGFYAGKNIWKIYFMPDEIGKWLYVTVSPDNDLSGKIGSLNSVPSKLPGRLIGDGNSWKLEDQGDFVSPVMLPTREWFKRMETVNGIDDFIKWSKAKVGALIIGTTLVNFTHEQDAVPYVKGREGELFNIDMWDRLNDHFDMMRDWGLGFYIMFYSDDEESPNKFNVKPQSVEEMRLFRYSIARFASYPIVLWDTGIDIGETRSDEWIDWFVDWFITNDPWQHPISSRVGGGSGGKFPQDATYYSDGVATLPSYESLLSNWINRTVPTAYTDRWRENYIRGNFDRDKIRRAVWEIGLVGGSALYVGGNENGGYFSETYASDFEAAPDVGIRNQFFDNHIMDFGSLVPHEELIVTGKEVVLAANPGSEYVAYVADGGSLELNLSNANMPLCFEWFNPRTGETAESGSINPFEKNPFTISSNGDWVLHVYNPGEQSFKEPGIFMSMGLGITRYLESNFLFLPIISSGPNC